MSQIVSRSASLDGPYSKIQHPLFIFFHKTLVPKADMRCLKWGLSIEPYKVLPAIREEEETELVPSCMGACRWVRTSPAVVGGMASRSSPLGEAVNLRGQTIPQRAVNDRGDFCKGPGQVFFFSSPPRPARSVNCNEIG